LPAALLKRLSSVMRFDLPPVQASFGLAFNSELAVSLMELRC